VSEAQVPVGGTDVHGTSLRYSLGPHELPIVGCANFFCNLYEKKNNSTLGICVLSFLCYFTSYNPDIYKKNCQCIRARSELRVVFFTMIFTSPTTHLACAHVAQAVRQQLGALPAAWMHLNEGVVKCRQCRARVDFLQVPNNGLNCVGFVNDRHDAVCRLLAIFCKRNGVPFLWA
jgi:hypothetical protein